MRPSVFAVNKQPDCVQRSAPPHYAPRVCAGARGSESPRQASTTLLCLGLARLQNTSSSLWGRKIATTASRDASFLTLFSRVVVHGMNNEFWSWSRVIKMKIACVNLELGSCWVNLLDRSWWAWSSYSLLASTEVKVLSIIRCSQRLMPLQVHRVSFPPVLSPGRLPAAPQSASCPLAPERPQPMGRPAGDHREGKVRSDSHLPTPPLASPSKVTSEGSFLQTEGQFLLMAA